MRRSLGKIALFAAAMRPSIARHDLEERIDRALGFPTHDPHGDPIPDANLEWPADRAQ